eukprot:2188571-Prymnesium_polylepis.1
MPPAPAPEYTNSAAPATHIVERPEESVYTMVSFCCLRRSSVSWCQPNEACNRICEMGGAGQRD